MLKSLLWVDVPPPRNPAATGWCPTWKRTFGSLRPRKSIMRAEAGPGEHCVVGIDLGTTNSAVALIEGQDPVAIPNQEGALTTPSIVGFGANDVVFVGERAQRQAALNPGNTFYSVKRFIGRDFEDTLEDAARVAFHVVSDPDGSGLAVLQCEHAEEGTFFPEEVSAYVIAKLLEAAEQFSGRRVNKAVVSVPAYFNDEQREATATAGRIAGLESVRIIREPVAAALAYGLSVEEDQTVLVFDLGGGTFDVSLLEVGGGVIEVLSTGGDPHLGGDDWDAAIVDWLIKEHLEPAKVDCTGPKIVSNLKALAEAAKIKLSSEEKVVIRMPVGGGGIEAVLTRQMFEGMTLELFRRARLPLDQACWQAGVDLGTAIKDFENAKRKGGGRRKGQQNVRGSQGGLLGPEIRPKRRLPMGEVLLVGGATRMPAVRRFIKNMTGLEPREMIVDPDLAVALGAAVQAGIYEGQVSDLMIMDVWQASLMRAYATALQKEEGMMADDSLEGVDGEEEDVAVWNENDDFGEVADESLLTNEADVDLDEASS